MKYEKLKRGVKISSNRPIIFLNDKVEGDDEWNKVKENWRQIVTSVRRHSRMASITRFRVSLTSRIIIDSGYIYD